MVEPLSLFSRGQFGQFLVSEAGGYRAREQAKIVAGSGKLVDGTILGRVTVGAAAVPAAAVAAAGNTGNGTLAYGTPAVDPGAPSGAYRVSFYAATKFQVLGPGGEEVGRGTTGAAFNGPVNFTITAGGTPFAIGDEFTMSASFAAGSYGYAPYDPAGTDGSQTASAILLGNFDASGEDDDVPCTVVVRDAEVRTSGLAFVGAPNTAQKDAAYAALASAGIAFR